MGTTEAEHIWNQKNCFCLKFLEKCIHEKKSYNEEKKLKTFVDFL